MILSLFGKGSDVVIRKETRWNLFTGYGHHSLRRSLLTTSLKTVAHHSNRTISMCLDVIVYREDIYKIVLIGYHECYIEGLIFGMLIKKKKAVNIDKYWIELLLIEKNTKVKVKKMYLKLILILLNK